jgi:hypothetical protein
LPLLLVNSDKQIVIKFSFFISVPGTIIIKQIYAYILSVVILSLCLQATAGSSICWMYFKTIITEAKINIHLQAAALPGRQQSLSAGLFGDF